MENDEIYWDDDFTMFRDYQTTIHMEVWDHQETDSNNLIGAGELGFNIFELDSKFTDWISLYNQKGKRIGSILLQAEYIPVPDFGVKTEPRFKVEPQFKIASI